MDRRNADTMLLDSEKDFSKRAVFIGVDWCRKDWTGCCCPRCEQPHRWRTRMPKRCRFCRLKFVYTANEEL